VDDGTTSRRHLADASEDALLARDPEAFDPEADAARETNDAATAAAVAAAGAELDAFLARTSANPSARDSTNANQKDSSARRDERARRSEEAFAEVLARRDRAKAAIGELARRVEDVQRELNALDEEEELEFEASHEGLEEEEEEEETELRNAFAPSARTSRGDDAWAEYETLASEPRGSEVEPLAEVEEPSANRNRTAGKAKSALAAERDLAAARLSRERRELARLVPEMQRARREMHEAELLFREREGSRSSGTFDGAPGHDAAADRRARARAKTASASADSRADRRVFAADFESPERKETRLALRRERRSAHARARDARVEPSRLSRRASRERLREKLVLIQTAVADAKRFEKTKHEDDVRRLLELKRSTDAVFASVSRAVAVKKAARDKKARRRAEEAAALLARGENPHVAFRRRDRLAEATREARERRDAHESRMAEIKKRLAREERELDRRERAAEEVKRTDVYFKRGLGAKAQQRRDDARLSGRAPKSARDAKALRHPDAAPLEALLTTREMALREKYPRDGFYSPGKGEKGPSPTIPEIPSPSPSLKGTERRERRRDLGGRVGDVSPRGEAAWSEPPKEVDASSDDGVDAAALDAAEAAERRARAKKVADIESARLLAVAARRAADPGRHYRKQVTCGRVFEGDAFAPSPRVVAFHDFAVGKKYTKKVTLTNVSFAASTFRVMPFEDHAHATVLEVSYEHPGSVRAGMSGAIFVKFTPTAAVALDAYLPLSTPSGVAFVPIECRPRRADVRVVQPELEFGEVVAGERVALVAELRNEGAAATPFSLRAASAETVCPLASETDVDATDEKTNKNKNKNPSVSVFEARVRGAGRVRDDGSTVSATEGVVPGYGSVFVDVAYAPREPKISEGRCFVDIGFPSKDGNPHTATDGDSDSSQKESLALFFRGAGAPPPVHLGGRTVVDFKTTALGCAYRDVLEVRNRGRVAARVSLKPPESLLGALDIVPDACFVQPGSVSRFSLKFKPDEALFAATRRERSRANGVDASDANDANEVTVTAACEARVRGREHPVPFAFKATLTRGDVSFDPPSLDFGDVPLGERGVLKLRVTNGGTVPQKFGVLGPERREMDETEGDVAVAPSRYGEILGGETTTLEVGFAPRVVGERVFALTLKSLLGAREFRVPCVGWGVRPALAFENGGNVLTLPPTAPREASSGSLFLRNKSETFERTFEICVPEPARARGLRAAPHVATLAPGERKRVRFEFCPPEEPSRRVVKEPVTDRIGETTDGKETSVSATDASPTKPGGSPEKPPATDGGVDDARATSSEEEDLSEALPESFRLTMFVKTARKDRDRSAFALAASGMKSGMKSDAGADAGADAEPVTVTGEDAETVTAQHIEVRTATRAPAIRVVNLPEYGDATEEDAATTTGTGSGNDEPLETPLDAKAAEISNNGSSSDASRGERAFLMDFGAVAVGAGTTRHVELRNASGETVTASPTQLDHEGVFSALAAFRPIPPNAVARLPIEFRPRREAAHEDVFVLRTPVGNARVVLRGEGVDLRAEVVAKPPPGWPASGNDENENGDETAETGDEKIPVVDCGDCVFGAASSTSVTIRNPTRAPFTWRASFAEKSVVAPGAGGTNRAPFVVSPAGGELPPGGEAEVAVTFSPHGGAAAGAPLGAAAPPGTRALPLSACRAILEVATTSAGGGAGAAAASSVAARTVVGRCWADGAYAFAEETGFVEDGPEDGPAEAWLAADGRPALADALRTPANAYERRTAGDASADASADAGDDAGDASRRFAVVATAREPARFGGAPVVVRVVVGSAVGPEGGADVTYAVGAPEPTTYYPSDPPDSGVSDSFGVSGVSGSQQNAFFSRGGWALRAESAAEGTVAAGARVAATFAFTPPAEAPRPGDPAFFGAHEWVEAECALSLKGGEPAQRSEGGGERRVAVKLRCRLLPPPPETRAEKRGTEDGAGDAEAELAEGDE